MNPQAKQIIEERAKLCNDFGTKGEKKAILEFMEMFIEHPTKPGYKRKDIEYFIKLITNE